MGLKTKLVFPTSFVYFIQSYHTHLLSIYPVPDTMHDMTKSSFDLVRVTFYVGQIQAYKKQSYWWHNEKILESFTRHREDSVLDV